MFQRGTGERFKYKDAVKEKYPKAVCVSICVKLTNRYVNLYYVKEEEGGKTLSKEFKTAENAWADVWLKEIKAKQ